MTARTILNPAGACSLPKSYSGRSETGITQIVKDIKNILNKTISRNGNLILPKVVYHTDLFYGNLLPNS